MKKEKVFENACENLKACGGVPQSFYLYILYLYIVAYYRMLEIRTSGAELQVIISRKDCLEKLFILPSFELNCFMDILKFSRRPLS